jgi:hypothetical protein
MGGFVISMFYQQQKLKNINHIFQVITNVMDEMSKPLVMPTAILHLYHTSVLEAHLIVSHFMPHECIT